MRPSGLLLITTLFLRSVVCSLSGWPTDGGDRYRTNSIAFTGPPHSPGERGVARSFLAAAGASGTDPPRSSHASPLITNDPAASVLWLDPTGNVLSATVPTSASDDWKIDLNWTGFAAPRGSYAPCSQLVLESDGGQGIFFADRDEGLVYGFTFTNTKTSFTPLPWSPLRLPKDPAHQPLTHHSLNHADGLLWVPLRYEFGSLVVHTKTGDASRIEVTTTASPVLAGSAGLPRFSPGNEDGGAHAWTVYTGGDPDTPPIVALNASGKLAWATNPTAIDFRANSRDNPVLVAMRDAKTSTLGHCIILLQQAISEGEGSPATVFAVNATTGTSCLAWPKAGVPLPPPYGDEDYVVGTPSVYDSAVTATSGETFLYYVAGNALLHIRLGESGCSINATSASLGGPGTAASTTPPILMLDAFGLHRHAVFVGTEDGRLLAFQFDDIARGPLYAYELPAPPQDKGEGGKGGFWGKPRVVGPYMAATSRGTVVLVTRDSAGGDDDHAAVALVAVTPANLPQGNVPPPPTPTPSPPSPPPPAKKGMGAGAAILITALVLVLAGAAWRAGVVAVRRQRARAEMDRSWYTSMAAFDDAITLEGSTSTSTLIGTGGGGGGDGGGGGARGPPRRTTDYYVNL
jgi:hypothetical protein